MIVYWLDQAGTMASLSLFLQQQQNGNPHPLSQKISSKKSSPTEQHNKREPVAVKNVLFLSLDLFRYIWT